MIHSFLWNAERNLNKTKTDVNLHFTTTLLNLENICPSADAGTLESQMKQSYGE